MTTAVFTTGPFTFELLPERALWWPDHATLFIADPHFGKAATYRALGQPVPSGTTGQTLEALDRALARTSARQLVVLGDFLHARQAHQASVMGALADWRARHASLKCVLVRGNHDDRAGDPPATLNFDIHDEPWMMDGLACCHIPPAELPQDATYALAGHVHPVTVVRGRGRDQLRLPCFDMGPRLGVLPAFGAFTGGWNVPALPGHTLGLIADDVVLCRHVPAQADSMA